MGARSEGEIHYHSAVKEYCICLDGSVYVQVEGEVQQELCAGQQIVIAPGVAHKIANTGEKACRYMVLQGVGSYDYIGVDKA